MAQCKDAAPVHSFTVSLTSMVTAMSKPPLDPTMLAQFTGSERFYRHAMVHNVIYAEGVKYVADTVGAYWLIDEIAFAQKHASKLRKKLGDQLSMIEAQING